MEGIVAGRRNSDRRCVFARRRYCRGLFWARARVARVIAREARKISANLLFGQKELSQGDEIRAEGPSLQVAVTGVVCFGLAHAVCVIAREARKFFIWAEGIVAG